MTTTDQPELSREVDDSLVSEVNTPNPDEDGNHADVEHGDGEADDEREVYIESITLRPQVGEFPTTIIQAMLAGGIYKRSVVSGHSVESNFLAEHIRSVANW
jgi:hypothetical protein